MMDFYKALKELYAEKQKLERVIASLEELQRTAGGITGITGITKTKRRGRKSMGNQERQEVSRRMKKYWAGRRKQVEEKPN
jgi:hypothetical protein